MPYCLCMLLLPLRLHMHTYIMSAHHHAADASIMHGNDDVIIYFIICYTYMYYASSRYIVDICTCTLPSYYIVHIIIYTRPYMHMWRSGALTQVTRVSIAAYRSNLACYAPKLCTNFYFSANNFISGTSRPTRIESVALIAVVSH